MILPHQENIISIAVWIPEKMFSTLFHLYLVIGVGNTPFLANPQQDQKCSRTCSPVIYNSRVLDQMVLKWNKRRDQIYNDYIPPTYQRAFSAHWREYNDPNLENLQWQYDCQPWTRTYMIIWKERVSDISISDISRYYLVRSDLKYQDKLTWKESENYIYIFVIDCDKWKVKVMLDCWKGLLGQIDWQQLAHCLTLMPWPTWAFCLLFSEEIKRKKGSFWR